MILKDIIAYLEQVAPLEYQESYDNSGLIVGNENMDVTSAVVSLDCTEEVVEEAISKGANLVISHHPIVFSGLKKFNGSDYVERTVIKAIENKVAIYAIHTNLDSVVNGVNKKIGDQLGLKNLSILKPKLELGFETSTESVGAGMIGTVESPIDEFSFLKHIKQALNAPAIKYTNLLNRPVSKVAFCGGSGSFLLPEAIAQAADVFITSDFKYHQYFDADNQIVIVDVGHYEAEKCTKELICEILTKKFPIFTLHFSEINTNPVNYL
jgi:dinuclear metal center YbgI/SA1388 family protein